MSDSYTYFAGVLGSYVLRVGAAYALCWLLCRLSPNPARRFLIWLFFLLGASAYWVAALVPTPLHASVRRVVESLPVHHASLAPHTLFFPASWAPALAWAGKLLAAAYLLGVALLLGATLWQHFALRRAFRHALEPSSELARLFAEMCRDFGVGRCQLLILPQLSSPATAGWLIPRVLLPPLCEQFDNASQLADVLSHELTHVARRDYLWATISDLLRCLLFFHPAVWWARQQMRLQRELACDVAVVRGRPEHCADYAQSLTRFARLRMLRAGTPLGIDFAASASLLGMRVRTVLAPLPPSGWSITAVRCALSLILLVCFVFLWPLFGLVAAFGAVPQVNQAAVTAPVTVMVPRPDPVQHHRRAQDRPATRASAPTPVLLPMPKEQSAQILVQPPAAIQPRRPATVAMSSAELGPQSNDFDQPAADQDDGGQPSFSETQPLPRLHDRAATVVQRVAAGLAEIGRQAMGREGRDHSGARY